MSMTTVPMIPRSLVTSRDATPPGDVVERRLAVFLQPDRTDPVFEISGLPGSFCMHYLPELDLRSGTVVACEALLRWQHPDFGLLRPGVTLEGTRWHDRLPGIEAWSVAQVCHQIAAWSNRPPVQVALNVSAAHLTGPEFFASLDRALAASGIDPTLLAIDVPVHAVALDPGLVRWTVEGLVERGVGVAIDGVGGSAPHQVVRQLPATAWKIDLGVGGHRRPGLHPLVAEALEEARAAGVTTTAKAVEDLDLLHAVRDLGFDRAFGYAISPAVGPAAMREMVERGAVTTGPLFGPSGFAELSERGN